MLANAVANAKPGTEDKQDDDNVCHSMRSPLPRECQKWAASLPANPLAARASAENSGLGRSDDWHNDTAVDVRRPARLRWD